MIVVDVLFSEGPQINDIKDCKWQKSGFSGEKYTLEKVVYFIKSFRKINSAIRVLRIMYFLTIIWHEILVTIFALFEMEHQPVIPAYSLITVAKYLLYDRS